MISPLESPIPAVKGTADRLPADFARLAGLEALLLDRFARAGYERMSTPVLESIELHERKSGAGIVSKLFELSDRSGRLCLRPELTAGVVRAFTGAEPAPTLPWRVSHAGPAFRRESPSRPDRLREFHQVGVERLGDGGPVADAEIIWLASWALAEAGVAGSTIRVGHVGLILEMLGRSGLPATAQASLVERLSEAAAEGGDVGSIGRGLDHFADWLRGASAGEDGPLAAVGPDDSGVDRLFRTLVPVVNGRRTGREIVDRVRRKWDLGHTLLDALDRVRDRARALAELKGPPGPVLDRLACDYEALAPDSVASLRALVESLGHHGVDLDRLELDLGFGRGIGFYSQMVFEINAPTATGPIELCGGGRYDGLARVLGSDRDPRGVGFAFGLERLRSALDAQDGTGVAEGLGPLLVVPASVEATPAAVRLATRLRLGGVAAILGTSTGLAHAAGRRAVIEARGDVVLHDPRWKGPRRTTPDELIRLLAAESREPKP